MSFAEILSDPVGQSQYKNYKQQPKKESTINGKTVRPVTAGQAFCGLVGAIGAITLVCGVALAFAFVSNIFPRCLSSVITPILNTSHQWGMYTMIGAGGLVGVAGITGYASPRGQAKKTVEKVDRVLGDFNSADAQKVD